MLFRSLLLCTIVLVYRVAALGSLCTVSLTAGNSTPSEPFWLENITHQGYAPYAPNASTYPVFRNVKDYGAVGDGVTDDTDAINLAISYGDRCGYGCESSTATPAVVYLPQGTYLVSGALDLYYYTVLVGDAKVPPTILASANFSGLAVIDADPYTPEQWYVNQNNFYRSVRNLVIDISQTTGGIGIHWQVSQATSLINLVFEMSTDANTTQMGLYMEDGSGGFMGDLIFNGGKYGLSVGNQQFTVRNVTINNAQTGKQTVAANWNWGWTWQGTTFNNCTVGFAVTIGTADGSTQGTASLTIIDAAVTDVGYFIQPTSESDAFDGSLVLNNIALSNVGVAVGTTNDILLAGGTYTIDTWVQGNVYGGTNPNGTFTQADIFAISKPDVLLAPSGWVFEKGHPQYADYSASQFISVRSQGAAGDGVTDDTAAIQAVFDNYAGCYIIYFDAGDYLVSSTITIPAGTQVVGEAWTTIFGYGEYFGNYVYPQPVIQVGETTGVTGVAEITDMIFSTRGPTAGAIVVEWNVHDPEGEQGAAGTWDTYIILGGRNGTDLQYSECPAVTTTSANTSCFAASTGLHITEGASAYLEGLWVWLADHDLDGGDSPQLTLWNARGIMSQSQGPVWMVGTGEHSIVYEYGLINASNHYMGYIQTETPYFQPDPAATAPFIPNTLLDDPTEWPSGQAWGLYIYQSTDILVFGGGHYSFFQNYGQTCDDEHDCQSQIVEVDLDSSNIGIYGLNTVYTTYQLSVNYTGIIYYEADRNGLSDTITVWTS